MAKIVLASKSPRRRELLDRMGLPHTVISVDADETYPPSVTAPEDIVQYISNTKAFAAANMVAPEDIVITADTMVFLDDRRLGKPRDEDDAFAMLSALSGREHLVCTGVTVAQGNRTLTGADSTRVRFAPLDEATIRAYIRTGEPMDKAGAYGIQHYGALLIEGIHGDYFNVVGLPVRRLSAMLRKFGVQVLA